MTFNDLGLIRPILRALGEQGYERPTPIQEKAIPPALRGRDVLGCAQTGTGKTCAFACPILQLLNRTEGKGRPIRALILTPTRELAIQIGESFEAYGKHLPLRSAVIFGGVGQNPQVEALRRGVDILVATPGRLLDLQGQGFLDFSRLEIFVLDEADRMLDMGFIHDVRRILKLLPEKKQTLFFSATMPPEVMELVNALLHDPAKVAVDPVSSPVEVIEQSLYFVDKANKTKLLAQLVARPQVKNALIFTRTKHGANKVASDLGKAGVTAAAIHGNKSQTARQQALADFKAGRVRCLVATDIAARGLDIEELSHVFNYNLPDVPETYVHRIGRTGRAGHGGTAVSFCDIGEKEYLKGIEKLLKRSLPVVEDHPWPMQDFQVVKDAKGKPVNADDAEARLAARERRKERLDRSRQEKETAKAAQGRKAPAAEEKQAPAPSAPRPAREKGEREAAAAPLGQSRAASAQTGGSKRGFRHQRLEETLPQEPAQASGDFFRPDPLAGDVIMDATARLLAPRKPTLSPGRDRKGEERRGQGKGSSSHRREQKAGETPSPGKGGGRQDRERTGQQGRKTQAGQEKEAPKASRGPRPEKSTRHARRKGEREASPRRQEEVPKGTGQRDSTQQPSLMKPYYISYDD